ncbi:hypothetical protein KBB96_01470 [Luteolibacter ambystomatis]|uniref:Uncharacterized protein n=1 Tax=Luteolibacter ambystomatis TaxID=2824561 RepID=A0A975J053_9BACT|nr:hypothetical protein [Luteolibacter ambystomatis]QUE51575.1 hypothetical protein KBB96_01470 [Luteolibacter ambystomatis]
MTTKNMLVCAAIACGTIATASADDVYLTGSSAFRGVVMKYLREHMTNKRAVFDKALNSDLTKSVDASSFIVLSGNYGGNPITIYCAWTGSVAGIHTVVESQNVAFPVKPADFDTNVNYSIEGAGQGVQGTTVNSLGNITSASFNHIPSFGFSDVFQSSTVYTTPANDTPLAVLPFKWVASRGAQASGVTNITPQLAQTLFKTGTVSLAQFTGIPAHAANKVYALGRNGESGTRLSAMAEMGVGVSAGLTQYQPVGNPVTSWTNIGNDGYVSGGTLAGALGAVTTAANGHAIAYLGVSDASTATNATNQATEVSHNGVFYTAASDVIHGRYTFWCYEHLFDRGDQTGQSLSLLTDLQTNLPTAFNTSVTTIRLGDMQCERGSDGETVFHFD